MIPMLLMSEFKRMAQPIYACKNCGKQMNTLLFNQFSNMMLHMKGYEAWKTFGKKEICSSCFMDEYPELMANKSTEEDITKARKDMWEERWNTMSEEEKKNYTDEKKWKKEVLARPRLDGDRKHFFDKYSFVTDSYLQNVLSSAFESGIYGTGIWARIVDYKRPINVDIRMDDNQIYPHIDYVMNQGGSITLWLFEDDDVEEDPDKGIEQYSSDCLHELTFEKLLAGFEKAYAYWLDADNDDYKRTCLRDQEDCDGELADCIIQFAIFGELIYG